MMYQTNLLLPLSGCTYPDGGGAWFFQNVAKLFSCYSNELMKAKAGSITLSIHRRGFA
jgi:hypothetical protein